MSDTKSTNEIDLLALVLKGIKIFAENLWLIIILFVLGSALGITYFHSSNKVYESKMIVASSILTDGYSKIIFLNFSKHLTDGNTKTLSELLKMSEEDIRKIESLAISNVAPTDETKENQRFLITAGVYDQKILPALQAGILQYIENNDFVKVRVEQTRNYLRQMIVSVELELKDMEELKTKIASGEFFQSAKGNVMFDPTTVNSKILELTDKKLNLENNLQLSSSVQLVDGFNIFEKHTRPRLTVSVSLGALIGLSCVVVALMTKYFVLAVAAAKNSAP